jgi:hypothetical protein
MLRTLNPFEVDSGSVKLGSPNYYMPLLAVCIVSAWIAGKMGLVGEIALIVFPFIAVYLYSLFRNPVIGLYTTVSLGFIILGVGRYVKIPQIGISIDFILVLTFLAFIFKNFHEKVDWKPAKKDISLLAALWLGYGLMSAANPEIRSMTVWLASFRGVSMYMFLIVTLTLLLINTTKRLDYLFYLWGAFSFLASLKGIMQVTIGVDPWEKAWLDGGAHFTHVLFGKLRVFSFLSDAGQFGANQAYSGVVFVILSLAQKDRRKKVLFLVVGILGLYGMLLSGTRGSISVPLAGFMLYFLLRKNVVVMMSGVIVLAVVFIFFKYTTIGQDNQQIRRMRTAFDPNDASLQLRLSNQKKLRTYLATRPFGGGLGHAGSKAMKSLPNTFLANTATDSWYVMIWAEQGIIGLVLHLFILFYIIIKSSYLIMFRIRDPILKMKMAALASGMLGVMAASYGNAVLGTMPTGILIYSSMALMLNAQVFEEEVDAGKSPAMITGIKRTRIN